MRGLPTSRMRSVAVALCAALGLLVLGVAPAGAQGPDGIAPVPEAAVTYLALGDSVAFGFRPGESSGTYDHPGNFSGSPEFIAADRHLHLLNASCPGETSDSFIDVTKWSNGCENRLGDPGGYRVSHPLHVGYSSRHESQLDYAIRTLKAHPGVQLVTVQVGANDGWVCGKAPSLCGGGTGSANIGEHIRGNLDTILRGLRGAGGYAGPIVVLTYYAPDYADAGSAAGWHTVDDGIVGAAQANGAIVADGFEAFRPTAMEKGGGDCAKAGLLFPNDIHPTEQGQKLLAQAVEVALKP